MPDHKNTPRRDRTTNHAPKLPPSLPQPRALQDLVTIRQGGVRTSPDEALGPIISLLTKSSFFQIKFYVFTVLMW